jgi:hypothetical protein
MGYHLGVKKRQTALTLLEVVIASFLFSGMVTVLGGVWVLHARAQQQSSHYLVAADLADQEMSRALALGFNGLAPSDGDFVQVWELEGRTIEQTFQSEVRVFLLEIPDQPTALKLVKVTVSYPDQKGELKKFTLESIVTDEG